MTGLAPSKDNNNSLTISSKAVVMLTYVVLHPLLFLELRVRLFPGKGQ